MLYKYIHAKSRLTTPLLPNRNVILVFLPPLLVYRKCLKGFLWKRQLRILRISPAPKYISSLNRWIGSFIYIYIWKISNEMFYFVTFALYILNNVIHTLFNVVRTLLVWAMMNGDVQGVCEKVVISTQILKPRVSTYEICR